MERTKFSFYLDHTDFEIINFDEPNFKSDFRNYGKYFIIDKSIFFVDGNESDWAREVYQDENGIYWFRDKLAINPVHFSDEDEPEWIWEFEAFEFYPDYEFERFLDEIFEQI